MRIIHSADWHIGKRLHNYELQEDFNLFSQWLINQIAVEKVDLLLISGDIFDLANPSSSARSQYYSLLVKLQEIGCQVIITGGNHDSPAVLNAPKEVLQAINISVIGSLPKNLEESIIPIYSANGDCVIIHAIPFLRDSDLRNLTDGVLYKDRIKAMQDGIQKVFKKSAELGRAKYPDCPHIAMGHLFTAGVSTSDSERDIQIGNEAKFDADRLGKEFDYVALGHIHKPQKVNAEIPTYYSGSPLPLSFSERKDEKRILLIDTQEGFLPKSIAVPNFRKLMKISGDLETIRLKIQSLIIDSPLKTLLEVELIEDVYSADIEDLFLQMINEFHHDNAEIVKTRMTFKDRVLGAHHLFDYSENLTDLKPIEMFTKFLETQQYTQEDTDLLKIAFNELVETIQQKEI